MRTTLWLCAILIFVAGSPAAHAQGKSPTADPFRISSIDLAATYSPQRVSVMPKGAGDFWLHGPSIEASFNFKRGFGVAASFSGSHASNFAPGADLTLLSLMAGPRYTFQVSSRHQSRLFGEALFHNAHAIDDIFPSSKGVTNHAGAFSMQLGGGWDYAVGKHFGIRFIELDYVCTKLSNNGSNTQDYTRLAFGVSYHIQRH